MPEGIRKSDWGETQLVEACLACVDPRLSHASTEKPGLALHTCKPSIRGNGGRMLSKFKASLNCMRPCLEKIGKREGGRKEDDKGRAPSPLKGHHACTEHTPGPLSLIFPLPEERDSQHHMFCVHLLVVNSVAARVRASENARIYPRTN